MAEIKNPKAFFSAVVRNSYKDEYRANDNFYNHISSVGDDSDVQREYTERILEYRTDFIEWQLIEANVENWLLLMEDEHLHTALNDLPVTDVEFLLRLAKYRFNKTDYAKEIGISQQAVSKRFHRLRKKIIDILKKGCEKQGVMRHHR